MRCHLQEARNVEERTIAEQKGRKRCAYAKLRRLPLDTIGLDPCEHDEDRVTRDRGRLRDGGDCTNVQEASDPTAHADKMAISLQLQKNHQR